MRYFILTIEWSQTDKEYRVVYAASKEAAVAKFKYENGPRYVTCLGSVDNITK